MTRLSGSDGQLSISSSRSARAVADDAGSRLSKAGADFLWRGGNDVVEALMDRRSVVQANENLGALLGRERGGEIRGALQIGPFDEA